MGDQPTAGHFHSVTRDVAAVGGEEGELVQVGGGLRHGGEQHQQLGKWLVIVVFRAKETKNQNGETKCKTDITHSW